MPVPAFLSVMTFEQIPIAGTEIYYDRPFFEESAPGQFLQSAPRRAACNLALLIGKMIGAGTPRAVWNLVACVFFLSWA
jgi:hypothetical protein